MKKWLALLLVPFAVLADDPPEPTREVVTNLTSDAVRTKGWRRQYIMETSAHELIDPSGKVASTARAAAIAKVAEESTAIMEAAREGLDDAMEGLRAVTNRFPRDAVTLRLVVPPDGNRQSFWAHEAEQWTDGTNDWALVWFSQELLIPPSLSRRYRGEEQTAYVDAEWPDWSESVDTNGFEGCRLMKFVRPDWARGVPLSPNPAVGIGRPDVGLSFGGAIVTVDGRETFTGVVTNSVTAEGADVSRYDNGVLVERILPGSGGGGE